MSKANQQRYIVFTKYVHQIFLAKIYQYTSQLED